jgi:glycosyltransferase involved in cell wall biosynthesis
MRLAMKMIIVHICLTGGYTEGIGYQENYLTKYQALDGHEVHLITTQYCWHENIWGLCKESEYKNQYGVHIVRLPYKFILPYKINTYLGWFKGLYNQLCMIKPNIIFIHNLQFQDIKLIRKYKQVYPSVKIFVDNHTDFYNSAKNWIAKNVLYKIWWKYCAKTIEASTEKFYGVLPARVDFLKDVYGLPADKIELLVMGADDEEVVKAKTGGIRKILREKHGITDTEVLILTGGKIDSNKLEVLTLMRAFIAMNRPNVKLMIFGSVMNSLKEEFDKLLKNKNIIYIGWVKANEIYGLFEAADLVVFPGLHSVLWEQAVGTGKACIFRKIESFDHIDLKGNCRYFSSLTSEGMERVLNAVIENNEINSMQKVAEKRGVKYFSYHDVARRSITES